MKAGDVYSEAIVFRQEDVQVFAEITGDTNPIHINEEYAASSAYGRTLVHGMYAASCFSRVLGTKFPGEGTVTISRTFTFVRPVFVGETYTMTFKVLEIDPTEGQVSIKCVLKNAAGRICITGVVLDKLPEHV